MYEETVMKEVEVRESCTDSLYLMELSYKQPYKELTKKERV